MRAILSGLAAALVCVAATAQTTLTSPAAQSASGASVFQGAVPLAPVPPSVAPGTPARVPLTAPQRPQLTEAQARGYERTRVLAEGGPVQAPTRDGWDPMADARITGSTIPTRWHYRVDAAAAASGAPNAFATIQAALNQAHVDALAGRHTGTDRILIGIAPGTYDEAPVVPPTPLPITLWGLGDAVDAVRIEANLYSRMTGAEYAERHGRTITPSLHADVRAPFDVCRARERIGTDCAVVLRVRNHGFQLRNVTVANRYAQDQPGNLHQALALMTDAADRVHLEQVHLYGHQDTLFLRSPSPDRQARVFVHRSLVAGDIDFIFGDAIAYFLDSEVRWVGGMRGARSAYIAAPSTELDARYGFVFEHCRFTSDGLGLAARREVYFARQWFYGARCSPYGAGGERCVPERSLAAAAAASAHAGATAPPATPPALVQPSTALRAVGKMVVLNSQLGAHVRPTEPWAPWNRAPDSPAYRPAQYDRAVFLQLLSAIGYDAVAWGWGGRPDEGPWLAEYRNRTEGAPAARGNNEP